LVAVYATAQVPLREPRMSHFIIVQTVSLRSSIADRKKWTNMQGTKQKTEMNRDRGRERRIMDICSKRSKF
jgi:hypothetical protein